LALGKVGLSRLKGKGRGRTLKWAWFKAITRPAAQALLPLVEDNGWFLDTELLVLAEKLGYRIFDLPVQWNDDPDSRVRIARTAWEDIKGIVRVRRNLWRGRYAGLRKEKDF
jgi:hypothetical protein